jgi:hypothetical protein
LSLPGVSTCAAALALSSMFESLVVLVVLGEPADVALLTVALGSTSRAGTSRATAWACGQHPVAPERARFLTLLPS